MGGVHTHSLIYPEPNSVRTELKIGSFACRNRLEPMTSRDFHHFRQFF